MPKMPKMLLASGNKKRLGQFSPGAFLMVASWWSPG